MNRISNFKCWQYNKRVINFFDDLSTLNLPMSTVMNLTCKDFTIQPEANNYKEIQQFILRYEWLGTMPPHTSHVFTARYGDILAGVVLFGLPNAFSTYLGKSTKYLERLISRGACASWTPKNLASKLISTAMDWLVANTDYRLFTAYADTEAYELGTIYQACNFYYLGKLFGSSRKYLLPNGSWVSDRYFRRRSFYFKIAKLHDIQLDKKFRDRSVSLFDNIDTDTGHLLKLYGKQFQHKCPYKDSPLKHKYAYVKGRSKKETKILKHTLESSVKIYPYPKIRGI